MYEEFYGLSARPFQLTPDASFYFESRTHRKALAYLGYGLAQGEGFIVITGDVGAGKSTLVAHLIATMDPARLNPVNIVSTQVEGTDMLRLVAQGMGLVTRGLKKAQLLQGVEQHLEDQTRGGKRTLLIVDEAQNLPPSALEELRMLSNFQKSGCPFLQIILLGQREFRDELAGSKSLEQLRQRVIAAHHLEPMGEDEIGPYIQHRLALAGATGRPEITAEAFAAIYKHTGGVPRRVNQFAGRLLLYGAVEKLGRLDADAVAAVANSTVADVMAKPEVLPLRTLHSAALREHALERRVAVLESQIQEQEAALRRVLTLLVGWVEGEPVPLGYHRNAA